jgi:putative ABC transport system substrate-binding protein
MLAGSAVVPVVAAGAGSAAVPSIGYLEGQSPDPVLLAQFQQGLREFAYFDGRNVRIEYRFAYGQHKQVPALAAELVRRGVNLIVTAGGARAASAAKRATSGIPILFLTGLDPVREKLVESLGRPGGNATGVSHYNVPLMSKRLELLKDLINKKPSGEASKIAYLINDDLADLEDQTRQLQDAQDMARTLGLLIHYARSETGIEAEFASMAQQRTDALLVDPDPFFVRKRALIVQLAAYYALPVGYRDREFVEAGGLMSYGPSLPESWRQIGQYAGRILAGAKPEDLPVMLPRKYELVINRKSAEALGLSLRRILADEIIG